MNASAANPYIILISWGGPYYAILVAGRTYHFELPYGCGLCPMNKDGSGRNIDWPAHVWDAIDRWQEQGQNTDGDGVCVWVDKVTETTDLVEIVTEMEMKAWIDGASYEELLSRFRFESPSSPWFTGDMCIYYCDVMKAKLDASPPGEEMRASKSIGWEGYGTKVTEEDG